MCDYRFSFSLFKNLGVGLLIILGKCILFKKLLKFFKVNTASNLGEIIKFYFDMNFSKIIHLALLLLSQLWHMGS